MYCPNCGQQQISGEMRFCSRCGLALSGLAEWLAAGSVATKREEQVQVSGLSPRRKGIRRAAKLMFFSGVLFPVFLVISLAIDEGAPMFFPFAVFFVSLVWMLYARLFSDQTAPLAINRMAQTSVLGSPAARSSLPPATASSMPVAGRQQVRTNELAQPPSVTDHTTRLLDNE
jgi:hypothetical protein